MPTPHVVLITADQWRGDCLSAAGHPVVRTPYLDALAARGARFDRAYSAVPTCVPARVALHTGLDQHHHGRVGYLDGVPWTYPVTLAGEFGRNGYQTHAIGKLHAYPERNRIGFDSVELHDGYLHHARRGGRDVRGYDDYLPWLADQAGESTSSDYADHGVQCNSVVARPWDRPERLHPTNWVVTRAIEFLHRRDPTAPMFLHLSFHRPHPPYDPPQWAFDQYLTAPRYEPVVGDWSEIWAPWRADAHPDALVADYDPATLHRSRAGYYGHMSHLDQQIERFLAALGEFGMLADTWIVFTSDHGEMLGEHHLHRKAFPYEGSARVPLIVAGPGLPGRVATDAVVELRDVMPTLLDCAGLRIPAQLDGRSMRRLAEGDDPPWREWLHGEHTLPNDTSVRFDTSVQWLTDGREKYVWRSADGAEQLFDLNADPHECHDLAREESMADRIVLWRKRLIAELRGRPEDYATEDALVPGRPPTLLLGR